MDCRPAKFRALARRFGILEMVLIMQRTFRSLVDRGMLQRFWFWALMSGMATILLGAVVFILQTLPPHTFVLATGPEGGAYHEAGIRYREILAQEGVDLQLRPTGGAMENLEDLRAPKSGVSAGFIQGGLTSEKESQGIESLGTVFYEPLWLFSRTISKTAGNLTEGLSGQRISIGPDGSATRTLALMLLERNKITAELYPFTPRAAAEKLIAGDIDFAFIVSSWDAPAIQELVAADGIELRSTPRADAYVALFPFLSKLVLPTGAADLAKNLPHSDVVLVAPKASLAVRSDLHPALQYLLLKAAVQIHSQPGVFHRPGRFPAAEAIDIPLSDEARRFYKSGKPFLHDHLPFWIATLAGRMLVVLVPLGVLLYPLFKALPQVYDWIMRSKIVRLYDEMRSIEREMEESALRPDAVGMLAKLDQLDQRANHLRVPTAYASMLYMLRAHIDLVRERLTALHDRKANGSA
jgi:TRAP-type uncharacterized transport system substrate-binding protein